MNKKAIGVQVLFYILMAFIFVWIILFGINQIAGLNDQLSETERLEIKSDLEETFQYCENPLNDGAKKTLEFSHSEFDIVCIVGQDIRDQNCGNSQHCTNLNTVAGDEARIIAETYSQVTNLESAQIVDDFGIRLRATQQNTVCWYSADNNFEAVEIVAIC